MSRALRLASAALMVATALPAQQVTARIGGELTAPQYSNFNMPVLVDMTGAAGATLGSYTARLTWNPAALSYSSYVSGGGQDSSAQGNFPPPSINGDSVGQGILKFSAISPAGAGGLVTIAQFQFYASYDTLPSPVSLSFSEMSAAGTFQDLLPILTVQGATFCRSLGKWGDLDRDGASNSRDALIVLSKVVGLAINPLLADTAVADVDADGRTTSRDALVILSHSVGMPVTGQRVLLPVAGSACGTGSARQLAIQPGAIDLAVGQPFRLLAQATDSAGRPVTLPQVTWRSSDYAVAGVDATTGLVSPRTAGTATITADVGPGVSASATVTVITRRPNWYVNIAAMGAPVQNGSAAFPFEGPLQALPVAAEGDTIRVAPGTYDWANVDGEVFRGVVVQGGTPGDTTTRPVFRGTYTAFYLRGGQRFELRNVVLQGFDRGVYVDAVRNLVLEDVKVDPLQNSTDGIYICPDAGLDTVRIDRTHFAGRPQSPFRGDAIYVSGCTNLDVKVMVVRDSRIEHFADAIYLYGVDSLQVLRTVIADNLGDGISVSQEYNETPAVHIAHSRVERNRYGAIDLYDTRSIVIDTSVVRADSADALTLYGAYNQNTAMVRLHGDSVFMAAPYYYWLDSDEADSLVLEDVVVRFPDDTVTPTYSWVNVINTVVRRSTFLNAAGGAYEVVRVFGNRLLADSVTMTGCQVAGCDGATGFHFNGQGPQAHAQVARSSFTNIGHPVSAAGVGTVLDVRAVTADSVSVGVYVSGIDSVAVLNSTFTRVVQQGVSVANRTGTRGPSLLAGNAITCTPPAVGQRGIYVASASAVLAFDTVTACNYGVEFDGGGTGSRVRQSTFRTNTSGIVLSQFSPWDTVLIAIDTSAVSGATVNAVSVQGVARLTHNRLENNSGNGLFVSWTFGTVLQAHDNAFVANGGYAVATAGDSVDASANWWGTPAQPGTTPPNAVNGSRINTTSPLAAPPANLPGLAPPVQRPGPAAGTGAVRLSPAPAAARVDAEEPAVRRERVRRERQEAKAAKDARHSTRRTRSTTTP